MGNRRTITFSHDVFIGLKVYRHVSPSILDGIKNRLWHPLNATGEYNIYNTCKLLFVSGVRETTSLFLLPFLFNRRRTLLVLETSDFLCRSLFKRFFHNFN